MCLLSSTIGNHHRCHHHSSHHHTAQRPPHYDIQTLRSPSKSSHTTIIQYNPHDLTKVSDSCANREQNLEWSESGTLSSIYSMQVSRMNPFVRKSCDNYSKLISSVILYTTFPGPTSEQRRSSGSSQSFLFLGGGQSCPYIHGEAIQHKCIEFFFME